MGKRSVLALDDLTLEIRRGEMFGLLGPNGAGKTTLLKILLAVVRPTSGTATLLGRPVTEWTSRIDIGFLPENHRFPPFLTALGALQMYGQLSRLDGSDTLKRAESLLERVGLAQWKNNRIGEFSKGMAQRLGIAQALINDPEILFLDEPTDGVDPIGRMEIRTLLTSLRDEGKTIFLNSHLLSEVEMICDRVAILHQGSLVRIGDVHTLTTGESGYRIELEGGPDTVRGVRDSEQSDDSSRDRLLRLLIPDPGTDSFTGIKVDTSGPGNPTIELPTPSVEDLNVWLDRIRTAGFLIRSVQPGYTSLEESFIKTISDLDKSAGRNIGRRENNPAEESDRQQTGTSGGPL